MIDSLSTRGGQLLGAYILVLIAVGVMLLDHDTGKGLLQMLIGAILRDMQDGRTLPNQPSRDDRQKDIQK